MKIHSDTLTTADLYAAVRGDKFYLAECSAAGSRKRAHAFEVALEGSSPYARQHRPGTKAATWDEWGIWMDRLFDVDPHAIIGYYDGRNDFIDKTQADSQRVAEYHSPTSYHGRTMTAPWLA